MDFLIGDCILCLVKKTKKKMIFFGLLVLLLLSTLEINHCS